MVIFFIFSTISRQR